MEPFDTIYKKVMNYLAQSPIEIATLVEAIENLIDNYKNLTQQHLTPQQKEMVDGYMGEVAKKIEEAITIARNYAEQLENAEGGAIHGGRVQRLHRHQRITETEQLTRLLSNIEQCPNGPPCPNFPLITE